MIYGYACDSITAVENKSLQDRIHKVFAFIAEHDLSDMTPGRYEIEGSSLYMNLEEFTTSPAEGRDFEAHKKYVDLFYVVTGEEGVDISDIHALSSAGYNEEKDRESLNGNAQKHMVLHAGEYMTLFPADAHRPAICEGEPKPMKKAVFKIAIE